LLLLLPLLSISTEFSLTGRTGAVGYASEKNNGEGRASTAIWTYCSSRSGSDDRVDMRSTRSEWCDVPVAPGLNPCPVRANDGEAMSVIDMSAGAAAVPARSIVSSSQFFTSKLASKPPMRLPPCPCVPSNRPAPGCEGSNRSPKLTLACVCAANDEAAAIASTSSVFRCSSKPSLTANTRANLVGKWMSNTWPFSKCSCKVSDVTKTANAEVRTGPCSSSAGYVRSASRGNAHTTASRGFVSHDNRFTTIAPPAAYHTSSFVASSTASSVPSNRC